MWLGFYRNKTVQKESSSFCFMTIHKTKKRKNKDHIYDNERRFMRDKLSMQLPKNMSVMTILSQTLNDGSRKLCKESQLTKC